MTLLHVKLPESQVVASLNVLLHGFQPERPILDKDGHCSTTHPDLSSAPIAKMDSDGGENLQCALTEVRGDWKFLKDHWLH